MQARAGEFLQKLLNMFWFVWFIIGMVWTFNSTTCRVTSPSLYILSLTFIIINLFILGSCILCCLVFLICFGIIYWIYPQAFGRTQNQGASKSEIDQLEVRDYQAGLIEDPADAKCAICLAAYENGEKLRFLPCTPKKHHFHQACVDEWLVLNKHCPFCKRPITETKASGAEVESGEAAAEVPAQTPQGQEFEVSVEL